MSSLNAVYQLLDLYNEKYRHPTLAPLTVSHLYDLFPENPDTLSSWPGKFPNGDKQGVYVIMDETGAILYIGKASMSHTIEQRLGAYFSYAGKGDKTCMLRQNTWSSKPKFLATIAVDPDLHFEAPALEEYLIASISPPDNRCGK